MSALPVTGAPPAPTANAPAPAASMRPADGGYKAANARTSRTKDSDGDYKPVAAASSPAAQSSAAVEKSLASLKVGG